MNAGEAFMQSLLEQAAADAGLTYEDMVADWTSAPAAIAASFTSDPMADPRAQILTADGWKPLAVKPTTREA